MATDVGSAVGYLDLDISGFLAGLKSAQSEADKQSKNIATTIGNNISSVGKDLSSVGTTLTKNVTVPLTAVGVAGLKVATDFEKGMSEVKAISGATGKDFDALREKAIELGADTAFSSGEVAEAMTEMAKAGWDSQQIIDGMSGVLDAAAASGEGLATVSTIVADAITGFGMEAKESTKVADLLTQAANAGTIGISDLGESFKYIAPVAGSMGLTIEDVTTALSAMSMAGIKGSQAGTSLRTMLTRMVKPTDAVAMAMDELGIVLTNSDGSFKSLDTIVAEMRTEFSGLTDEQKTYYAAVLAGQEGMSGLLSLLNLTQEEYDAIAESMDDSGGVAAETAAIMQDNLLSKVEQLGGSLESLAIKLADYVIPSLQKFVECLTSLVDKFVELDPETQKIILKFGAIAIAAGPVIAVVGKLISGVGGLVTAFGKAPGVITKFAGGLTSLAGKLSGVPAATSAASTGAATMGSSMSALGSSIGALASAAGPILAVVAVIAILVAAFVNLWKNNEEFRNNILVIWEQIKATFEEFTNGIVERLNALGFDFESIGEVLKAIWKGLCDFLAPIFEGVFQNIANIFDTFVSVFFGVWDFFSALFTGDWEGAWSAIQGIFGSVWDGISATFENITNTIIGIAQTVLSWFGIEWNTSTEEVGNKFSEIWQGVVDFFTGIWEGVEEFFTGLWQNIWSVVGPLFDEIVGTFQMAWDVIELIWEKVQPFFAGIWEGIKAVFSVVVTWFKTIFSVAWEAIKGVWDVVVSWFLLLWENLKAVFQPVIEFFKGIFSVAWEAIKAVWNNVVNFFTMIWAGIKAVFAVVKGVLSGNFTDAWNAIKNVWNKVKTFFQGIWNGVKNVFGAVGSFFENTFSAAWNAIKKVFSNFGSFFSNLWNTIKNTFSAIGTKIGDAIGGAVKKGINGVLGIIENTINGFFGLINGAIDLINKIPGVNIKKISDVKFARLAKGGVVDKATPAIFGEDGAEAVVPLEKNLGWMKNLVKEFISQLSAFFDKQIKFNERLDDIRDICQSMLDIGRQMLTDDVGYVSYYGFGKSKNANKSLNNPNNSRDDGNGDTFNFYSPKSIDEVEAARQLKKTKRELAEGF